MAPRKKSGKTRVPAHRYLRYLLEHTGTGEDSHYLDMAKDLSGTNRRLYQQGKVYRIKSITVHSSTTTTFVKFATVPNTYVSRNAWKRGKAAWDEMNRRVLDAGMGSRKLSRWHDYKVAISADHLGDADLGVPIDSGNGSGASAMQAGEWVYSEYESPDGSTGSDSYGAYFMGDHTGSAGSYTAIGLIQSYGESRSTVGTTPPGSDSDGDDDPLANLFDAGTTHDEIIDDLNTDNNAPPYAGSGHTSTTGDKYPGAGDNMSKPWVVREVSLDQDANGAFAIARGFDAICGLIEIETTSSSDGDIIEVLVELEAGDYKGVFAGEI